MKFLNSVPFSREEMVTTDNFFDDHPDRLRKFLVELLCLQVNDKSSLGRNLGAIPVNGYVGIINRCSSGDAGTDVPECQFLNVDISF